MLGNEGDDTIEGGYGTDQVDGGPGDDTISGTQDRDTIQGGEGNDRISEVDGAVDRIDCGPGAASRSSTPRTSSPRLRGHRR